MCVSNRYHPVQGSVNGLGRRKMAETDSIQVKTATVGCDGGGGPLGHPMVYLKIADTGDIVCPYCSRHYVLAEGAEETAGH